MADNVTLPGTGEDISTEEIGGVQIQRMKIITGADGVDGGDVAAGNPFSISGTVTANLSATDNAVLDSILAKLSADPATQTTLAAVLAKIIAAPATEAKQDSVVTALGTLLTELQAKADLAETQPVSAAALPLPTDAATQTTLAALLTELQGKADTAEAQTVDATGSGDVPVTLDSEAVVLGAGSAAIGKLGANSGVDIGDVDVTSIASGETHIGAVGASDTVVTITCTLPTGALTANDVMFDTQEIALAARVSGGNVILKSVVVRDLDNQGAAFDLIFLNANTSIGTEDSPAAPADSVAQDVIGSVSITASDYVDFGNSQIATVEKALQMQADGSTSIWVAGITRGTPTYTASGVEIVFGFLRS